jgi:hypothetical protein
MFVENMYNDEDMHDEDSDFDSVDSQVATMYQERLDALDTKEIKDIAIKSDKGEEISEEEQEAWDNARGV